MNRKKRSNIETSQNGAPMKAIAANHRQPAPQPPSKPAEAELADLHGAAIGHGADRLCFPHQDPVRRL